MIAACLDRVSNQAVAHYSDYQPIRGRLSAVLEILDQLASLEGDPRRPPRQRPEFF
jgi:hypothetical protein